MAVLRNWCFTLNNPADHGCDITEGQLPVHPKERYVVWQLEAGENGTPHYQGYIELTAGVRLGSLKKWLPTAHFEGRKGTRDQARDYCTKSDSRVDGPWERGNYDAGGQGKRNDLADACATLKAHGLKRVAQDHPTAFVKFSRGLRDLAEALREPPRDEDFTPRYWQQVLLDQLSLTPDDRTIFWVTDKEGGRGKSRLARHLIAEHGAAQLGGRIADMAYAYNYERIVIFDITRAAADHSDHLYSFAESLKNGIIVSPKYEATTKVCKAPHVVFFSNAPPDTSKWTRDRLVEFDLANPDLQDDEAAAQAAQEAADDANAPFL